MKQIAILIAMVVLLVSTVAATTDSLTPQDLTMAYTDTQIVQYCIANHNPANGVVPIVVLDVCKDADSISGCQPGDMLNPAGFSVTVLNNITTVNGAGCANIQLDTNLTPQDAGLFYYSIGDGITVGQEGKVVSETGSVFVPEFGIVASALVLGLAGLYIYKRRK